MFNNALWQSKSNSKQPLWFIMGPMLLFLVCIPFTIHFWGVGLIFAIDVTVTIVLLAIICIFGRKFKWNNGKLLFAVAENGLYFTQIGNNNGSYFYAERSCIKGYSARSDGNYHTVAVYLNRRENAGIMGNIDVIKMIKIENFTRLKEVLAQLEIPEISDAR